MLGFVHICAYVCVYICVCLNIYICLTLCGIFLWFHGGSSDISESFKVFIFIVRLLYKTLRPLFFRYSLLAKKGILHPLPHSLPLLHNSVLINSIIFIAFIFIWNLYTVITEFVIKDALWLQAIAHKTVKRIISIPNLISLFIFSLTHFDIIRIYNIYSLSSYSYSCLGFYQFDF